MLQKFVWTWCSILKVNIVAHFMNRGIQIRGVYRMHNVSQHFAWRLLPSEAKRICVWFLDEFANVHHHTWLFHPCSLKERRHYKVREYCWRNVQGRHGFVQRFKDLCLHFQFLILIQGSVIQSQHAQDHIPSEKAWIHICYQATCTYLAMLNEYLPYVL